MKINIIENIILPDGTKGNVGYIDNRDDSFYLIVPTQTILDFDYVYSMWVMTEQDDRTIKVVKGSKEEVSQTIEKDKWTRVVLNFKADGEQIYIELQAGTYYLYKAQLEQGTIVSDWKKSTEDIEHEIKSEVSQLSDSVSISVKELNNKIVKNSADIDVALGKIELKVSTGEVSSSLSLEEGDIDIVGNRIAIKSDFFELTKDGSINATSGKVGCFNVNKDSMIVSFDDINAYPIDDKNRHFTGKTIGYEWTDGDTWYYILRMYEHDLFKNYYYFEYFGEEENYYLNPVPWDNNIGAEPNTISLSDVSQSETYKSDLDGYDIKDINTDVGFYAQYGKYNNNGTIETVYYITRNKQDIPDIYYLIESKIVELGDNTYPETNKNNRIIMQFKFNTKKDNTGKSLIAYNYTTMFVPMGIKASISSNINYISNDFFDGIKKHLELFKIESNKVKLGTLSTSDSKGFLFIPHTNEFQGKLDIKSNVIESDDIFSKKIYIDGEDEERIGSFNVPNGRDVEVYIGKFYEDYIDNEYVRVDKFNEKSEENDKKISEINNSISSHTANKSNPHSVTKSQVGLGNVENKSSATIRGELTKSNVTTALGYTPYTPNEVDNKLASLETNIDWKESVATYDDIATTYPNPVDGWTVNVKDTDYTYRYNGTSWVAISANAIPKATNNVDGLLSKEDHTKYEDANSKKHTHSNKSVIDGISSTNVSNWNNAQANVIETVKVNGTALTPSSKAVDVTVPTKVSQLTNDSGFKTTDNKVTQTATTNNASYPLLLAPSGQTSTTTTTSYFDSEVTLNPSTNTINANVSGSSVSCTGNASTSTKLSTARAISLGTAVTSTATKFDGSSDITIPVNAVQEAYLTWGGRNRSGSFGCIDASMIPELGANRLAFMPASSVEVQYSRDNGATWNNYAVSDGVKIDLFNGNASTISIGASTDSYIDKSQYQARIIITTDIAKVYTTLNKFVMYVSTAGSSGCWCTIDAKTKANVDSGSDTWTTFADKVSISGWSGYNVINTSSITTYGNTNYQYQKLRFTFGVTSHPSTSAYPGLQIYKIMGFGGMGWNTPSTMAKYGRIYTYDSLMNVNFPASVSAKSFSGSLNGNSTTATALTTSAGSTTQPIYFKDGKPTACSYTLGKSVPSDAVFTDTNTHYASGTIVNNSTTATSNTSSALTNGNVYLNHIENGAVKNSHKISGSGATTVTSDASGNIVISSTDTNTTYSSKSAASGGTDVSLVTTGEKYNWNNKGTYSKPSGGIPKSDLASAVQTSLGKADTALQSYTEKYTGTITGIKMNGVSKGTSGVVDLGTVITSHQDISGKLNKSGGLMTGTLYNEAEIIHVGSDGITALSKLASSDTGKLGQVIAGNSTPTSSTGGAKGAVIIYGEGTNYASINANNISGSDKTFALPNKEGTLALLSDTHSFAVKVITFSSKSFSASSTTTVTASTGLTSGQQYLGIVGYNYGSAWFTCSQMTQSGGTITLRIKNNNSSAVTASPEVHILYATNN